MCYFLTIAVPEKSALHVPEVFARGYQVWQTTNTCVRAALPPEFTARLITSGMCSCGLYSEPRSADDREHYVGHLRQKYAGRGWSQAKIDRAVAQTSGRTRRQKAPVGLHHDVVERWQSSSTGTTATSNPSR